MSDQFLGEIRMISFNFPPRYWAFCNGQTLQINQNQALFALLGTSYGGNGQTTYGLPNLQSRVPVGWDSVRNSNSLGQIAGEEQHTLTAQECPLHTHTFMGTAQAGTGQQPSPNNWVGSYNNAFGPYPANPQNVTSLEPSVIGQAGSSLPHENRQPYLCINFAIALSGVFPSRN